jgi:GSH-dependent disulfide-bond oxidoreductase
MPEAIDLYYWPTLYGWKITIFLEEVGLPYNVVLVDITAGDQFEPDFLKISPNNKVPAIVDPEGPDGAQISVFESEAMLMFQMGHVGPMLGQTHHFRQCAPEEVPYAIDRYTNEAARLYEVMDWRLSETDYFASDEYSIADMAIYPWLVSHERQGQRLEDFPNLARWYENVATRPAVERALEVGSELRRPIVDLDEKARDTLFGNRGRAAR